jgi:glutamate synthase (NADPH/NADH) small chain
LPDVRGGRIDAGEIERNFADLRPPLARGEARVAAERCLFCFDAPCITACPTSIDVPLFIRQIAAGNVDGAARTILDANIFGGMCARVCPTETLCEDACVRMAEGKPIEIGRLQRFATDHLLASGSQPYHQGERTGKRVAVVGAGPAGLSCAHRLSLLGHDVVVYDARPRRGGLNEYGIAAYKTVDDFAQREVDFVLGVGGIDVEQRRLGGDLALDDLVAGHDAVFLAVGLAGVNALDAGDRGEVDGVVDAVRFIEDVRQADDLARVPVGRRVVVVGGGMTAIDAASQARRLGAEEVTIVYRRGLEQMKASRFERELAQTDGVLIRTALSPVTVLAEAGRLVGVELERMDADGERVTLACDQLFLAIGQALAVRDVGGVDVERGRIHVDAELRTSRAGVWAGGDCIGEGEDLTVTAVEHGKRAAHSIDAHLRARGGGERWRT